VIWQGAVDPMLLSFPKPSMSDVVALESRACFLLGLAVAVPVAYPSEPYYWFAFIVALFGLASSRPPKERLVLLFVFLAIGAVSTVATEYQHLASLSRSLPIALGSILVLAGFGFRDRESFVRGYCYMMAAIAALIVFTYLHLGLLSETWQTFIYPDKRLWGEPYFPDWPNFLAFGLGLAAIIAVSLLGLNSIGILCLTAAILTTSRMALVALAVLSVIWMRTIVREHGLFALFLLIGGALTTVSLILWDFAVALAEYYDAIVSTGYGDRLLKLGDRSAIWARSLEILNQHPLLGIGAVPLDESIGLPSSSIHNSYLEVTLRFGVLGLVTWFFLFLPSLRALQDNKGLIPVFLFVAISALFNNVLKHPHYLVMYGVLLAIGSSSSVMRDTLRREQAERVRRKEISM